MSGPFWRPSWPNMARQLWARCDMCQWSGPFERFSEGHLGSDVAYFCDHDWCLGSPELRRQLESEGWIIA